MLMERIMIQCDPCCHRRPPPHTSALQCTAATILSVNRHGKVRPLLHAELTGPQAYHYGVIVESYYCLQECSWQGSWPALSDRQFTFLVSAGRPLPLALFSIPRSVAHGFPEKYWQMKAFLPKCNVSISEKDFLWAEYLKKNTDDSTLWNFNIFWGKGLRYLITQMILKPAIIFSLNSHIFETANVILEWDMQYWLPHFQSASKAFADLWFRQIDSVFCCPQNRSQAFNKAFYFNCLRLNINASYCILLKVMWMCLKTWFCVLVYMLNVESVSV